MIVNDNVRSLDAFLRTQRYQSKISRTGADKIDFAALVLTRALAHARLPSRSPWAELVLESALTIEPPTSLRPRSALAQDPPVVLSLQDRKSVRAFS